MNEQRTLNQDYEVIRINTFHDFDKIIEKTEASYKRMLGLPSIGRDQLLTMLAEGKHDDKIKTLRTFLNIKELAVGTQNFLKIN